MEILDRNNITQLALNLGFDSKTVTSATSLSFIDMIKAPSLDSELNTNEQVVFDNKQSASLNKAPKVKDTKDNQFSGAEKTKKEKSVKETPAPKAKEKKSAPKSDNNVAAYNDSNTTPAQTQAQPQAEATAVSTANTNQAPETEDATLNVSNEPTLSDNEVAVTIGNPVIQPQMELVELSLEAVAPLENMPTSSFVAELSQAVAGDVETNTEAKANFAAEVVMPTPSNVADNSAQPELIIPEASVETKATSTTVADTAILQQAQILDQKIVNDKPLKIDVNTQEAKIAEPVQQNIIQNSFELTSLLQSTDGNLSNLADNSDILPEKTPSVEINNPEVELDTRNFNSVTNQPELKAEYVMSTSDNLANAALSDKNATLQSQQVETIAVVQTNRHDVNFQAKIQDLNTDNSLKGLAKEAVEQIKVNITKSAVKNVDTIDIELKPEELGKVQVRMYIHKDGKLHADIIASRQTTAEMLQREVENLSKAFQDAGYDTDKQSFNFSSQEENQAGKQSGEQKLQQFIGETLEQEAEETTANDNLIYDPRVGLNIRV